MPSVVLRRAAYPDTRQGTRLLGALWSNDTVWLDSTATKKGQPAKPGTVGFGGVSQAVWNFHIGGYQVCEQWLKDHRGRTCVTCRKRGLAKFADIARESVEARGGRLLELRGDEALCVFASTREAIRAAVDLQPAFLTPSTP